MTINRRDTLKRGFAALSTLALGEMILLAPEDANAQLFKPKDRKLYGKRKAERRTGGKGRLKNDYSKAVIKKGVCLNCSTVCGIQGYVIDGKLVKVSGNPLDRTTAKRCAPKGKAAPQLTTTLTDYSFR